MPPPRTAAEAERLWEVLGDADPAAMEPTLWALARAPDVALPLLQKRLRPVPPPLDLPALIAQLRSPSFKDREAATRELTARRELAAPALRAALDKGTTSLEQRWRIERVLAQVEDPLAAPPCLRELRAVEVLERIGTSAARQLLERVAAGAADALLTREARMALAWWPEARGSRR